MEAQVWEPLKDRHPGDMETGAEWSRGAVASLSACGFPPYPGKHLRITSISLALGLGVGGPFPGSPPSPTPACLPFMSQFKQRSPSSSSLMPPVSCEGSLLWDPQRPVIYHSPHVLLGITVVCAYPVFPSWLEARWRKVRYLILTCITTVPEQSPAHSAKV